MSVDTALFVPLTNTDAPMSGSPFGFFTNPTILSAFCLFFSLVMTTCFPCIAYLYFKGLRIIDNASVSFLFLMFTDIF